MPRAENANVAAMRPMARGKEDKSFKMRRRRIAKVRDAWGAASAPPVGPRPEVEACMSSSSPVRREDKNTRFLLSRLLPAHRS